MMMMMMMMMMIIIIIINAIIFIIITLPKFNMEPKNDGFQRESPIPGCHFQVPC